MLLGSGQTKAFTLLFVITSKVELAMSFFDRSRNFVISGGQFTNITTKTDTRKKGIDLLYEHTAPGAFHNSAERYDPPKCHPNTRIAVIQAIVDWVEDSQKTTFIKWMYGAAGAGKSAIAQEIAERYHESEGLAASFFWSRNAAGRNNETRLISSLAYQLLITIPQIRGHVEEAVESDPSIFTRSMETQMESLVIGPLKKVFGHGQAVPVNPEIPKLIVLDGLDECGTPQVQQYILKVIAHSVRKFPIPFFLLIASRPEQAIRASFHVNPLLDITAKLILNENYHPDDDIRLFLTESFESVKSTHELRTLLTHVWPTEHDIKRLIRKSSGQFIYAATVVKFVSTSRRMPSTQLEIILGISVTEDTPFAELDALYHHIFSSVEDSHHALEILACLFLIRDLGGRDTMDYIQKILSYSPGQIQLILTDLHSVVEVPDVGDEHNELRVLHASLQDFLMDPARSRNFFINERKAHAHITQCFLEYINTHSNESDTESSQYFTFMMFDNLDYHCSLSFPTRGLLDSFFDFDFLQWASYILEKFPDDLEYHMVCYFRTTRLYGWLQAQDANVQVYFGRESSLSIHHSYSWEVAIDLLCKRLCDGLSTDKDIITTALTHPQILYHYNKASNHPFSRILNCEILDDCLDGTEDGKEPIELQKYLRDPERAGTSFVNGAKYATLSAKIVKFILKKFEWLEESGQAEGDEGTPYGNSDIMDEDNVIVPENDDRGYLLFAIQLLPFYLSHADYEPDLARCASNVLKLKFRTREGELPTEPPPELEGVLLTHPDIADVVVIGVEDLKEYRAIDLGMNNLHRAIDLYLKKEPSSEAESQRKRKYHMNCEETRLYSGGASFEAANLVITNLASPLIPSPPKRLRLMDLLNPNAQSESDIHQ